MSLPQLNEVPKYNFILPSTGESIGFRPFLVKEQKVLLMAYESKDKKSMIQAMMDTLNVCVENANVKDFSTFDADYAFMQVRAKSVGEKIDVSVNCSECKQSNPVVINLEEISVENVVEEGEIEISPGITVKMKYPSYDNLIRNGVVDLETESITAMVMALVKSSMYAVVTEEEHILLKNESPQEIDNFIDSMTNEQYQKLAEYVQEIPNLFYEVSFECNSCGHKNAQTIRGIDDFF